MPQGIMASKHRSKTLARHQGTKLEYRKASWHQNIVPRRLQGTKAPSLDAARYQSIKTPFQDACKAL
jgi:hypothetical protein